MKACLENGKLTVVIDVEDALLPSASGKTLVVASSRGNFKTSVVVNGQNLVVGLNAYIKNVKTSAA